MNKYLISKLNKLNSYRKIFCILTYITIASIIFISLITVAGFIDYFVVFNNYIRLIILIGLLIIIIFILIKLKKYLKKVSLSMFAVFLENNFPELNDILITAVELEQKIIFTDSELHKIIVNQAETKINNIIPQKSLFNIFSKKLLVLCVLLLFIFLFCLIKFPLITSVHIKRIVLPFSNIKSVTSTLISTTGNIEVLKGEDAIIKSEISGVIPDFVRLFIFYNNGSKKEIIMYPINIQNKKSVYKYIVSSVKHNFYYQISAGDALSGKYKVTANNPPEITELSVKIKYPKYVNKTVTIKSFKKELKILPQSYINIYGKIKPADCTGVVNLINDTKVNNYNFLCNKNNFSVGFNINNPGYFKINIFTDNGHSDTGAYNWPITFIKDFPPKLETIKPDKDIYVLSSDTVQIITKVSDDFGVKEISLNYLTENSDKIVYKKIMFNKKNITDTKIQFIFDINDIKNQRLIPYWFETTDFNNITGPGKTTSKIFFITVVEKGSNNNMQNKNNKQTKIIQIIVNLIKSEKNIIKLTFNVNGSDWYDNYYLSSVQKELMYKTNDLTNIIKQVFKGKESEKWFNVIIHLTKSKINMSKSEQNLYLKNYELDLRNENSALTELLKIIKLKMVPESAKNNKKFNEQLKKMNGSSGAGNFSGQNQSNSQNFGNQGLNRMLNTKINDISKQRKQLNKILNQLDKLLNELNNNSTISTQKLNKINKLLNNLNNQFSKINYGNQTEQPFFNNQTPEKNSNFVYAPSGPVIEKIKKAKLVITKRDSVLQLKIDDLKKVIQFKQYEQVPENLKELVNEYFNKLSEK